jgi:glycine hydroxymethyltransferase
VHHYGLDPQTEQIDYTAAALQAKEVQPKALVVGASAYPRTLDFAKMREIADSVGAVMICDIAHIAGLVAAGLHPSPVPLADVVTTTTHKTLRGPRSGLILCKARHAKAIDSQVFPGMQGGPFEHIIAAKAVAFREALQPSFKEYQQRILDNARALAAGLVAGGLRLVAGGTDTHLMLCDLRPKKLTGKVAEAALQRANITTNKNMIPGDPEKPFVTSGLRLGTPALTTRGMGPAQMATVAQLILSVLDAPESAEVAGRTRGQVRELCLQFPLYPKRAGKA